MRIFIRIIHHVLHHQYNSPKDTFNLNRNKTSKSIRYFLISGFYYHRLNCILHSIIEKDSFVGSLQTGLQVVQREFCINCWIAS